MMRTRQQKEISLSGLAEWLYRDNLLNMDVAHSAMLAAKDQGITLANYLVSKKILSSEVILECCKKATGLPVFDLNQFDPSLLNEQIIALDFIHRHRIIPLRQDKQYLLLGTADPTNQGAVSTISFQTGLRVRVFLVLEHELDKIITLHCSPRLLHAQVLSIAASITPSPDMLATHDNSEKIDEPVIVLVDRIIANAIENRVSDIHIEPHAEYCRIRFRRDGLLYEAASISAHLTNRVITRIKIMANMNIAEKRLPQDGRTRARENKNIDLRVSTCPTLHGEKLVIRLLNSAPAHLAISALGMNLAQQQLFSHYLSLPQGLILVTGPTGSGKSMTLYTALSHLNKTELNIMAVEDPVEIALNNINQVNVNLKIGLDFATTLRSLLRQDPDILMIGEIRDQETATIAVQAAQTGHLVLSTLHTNNALSTFTRLSAFGLAMESMLNSMTLVIAQRLIRKLCEHCKKPDSLLAEKIYRAVGCERCHQGYHGRIGIFELLPVNTALASLILERAHHAQIQAHMQSLGMMSLRDACLEKINQGLTTYSEMTRVLGAKHNIM